MARYNPKNKQHRKTLATRIVKMLVSRGFSLDASSKVEDVYEQPVAGTTARVRVFTSIVKGEMRVKDADAIRICAVLDTNGSTRGLVKSTRVNRTGDTDGITARLLDAMRKTYKTALKRANDPGFLALPVKASKKRWVPKAKKAGSKRKTAKRINAALKAAAEKPDLTSMFAKGMLVHHTSDDSKVPGLVREIDEKLAKISVFWLNTQSAHWVPPGLLRPLMAA